MICWQEKNNWLWHINSKDYLAKITRNNFFWMGERDEKFNNYLKRQLNLLNENFNFEEQYIKGLIQKFLADEDQFKKLSSEDGQSFKTYENFILVVHGLSENLISYLESEYGAFQVHLSSREQNTNIETHDCTLFYDDEDFEQKLNRVLNIFTKKL